MPVWNRIVEILKPTAEHRGQAEGLLQEYRRRGCLPHTSRELLSLPDETIAAFYALLMDNRVPVSPVSDRSDSGWLASSGVEVARATRTGISIREAAPGRSGRSADAGR